MKKKTLLFVGNTAWSMYNFRLEVLKFFTGDYNVIVLAPEDAWGNKLLSEGISYIPITIDNKGTSPLNDIKLMWDLYWLYRKCRPSLIFHYTIKPNIYGTLASLLCRKVKSIAVVTGAGSVFVKNTWLTKLVSLMFKCSLKFSHEVWFLNNEDRDLFISSKMVDRSKSVVLPSEGINTDQFKDCHATKNTEKFIFLYLGRVLWDKGVGEFVEAARKIKETRNGVIFQILGFLDQRTPSAIPPNIVTGWHREGIVEYLGSSDDVKKTILESNCIVLPSSYREGIPRSLLEAASLEKPVIASDIAGCRAVVEDGVTGYLCQPRNAFDLQQKMEKMIGLTIEQRESMGKAARKKIKKQFEIKAIIEQYQKSVIALS